MRQRVIAALRPLHAISIEAAAQWGIPDVNHLLGWMELKQIKNWPVRANTIVRVPLFTPQQRVWLRARSCCPVTTRVINSFTLQARAMDATLLLRARHDWLLLPGVYAAEHLGVDATRHDLLDNSIKSWEGGLDDDDFLRTVMTA